MFTIALLKDTNWYAEINEDMADPLVWGKDKGCTFLHGSCHDLINDSTITEF